MFGIANKSKKKQFLSLCFGFCIGGFSIRSRSIAAIRAPPTGLVAVFDFKSLSFLARVQKHTCSSDSTLLLLNWFSFFVSFFKSVRTLDPLPSVCNQRIHQIHSTFWLGKSIDNNCCLKSLCVLNFSIFFVVVVCVLSRDSLVETLYLDR